MGVFGWAGNPPKENKILISKDAQPWMIGGSNGDDLWNTRLNAFFNVNSYFYFRNKKLSHNVYCTYS